MKKLAILLIILFISSSCMGQESETKNTLEIPKIKSEIDKDSDGIDDYLDILENARSQIGIVTKYDTNYYKNAYPPEDSGACADVFWRALKGAGYDFKQMLDEDISKNPYNYPQNPILDTNINFRRVQNIKIFLENYAEVLSPEIIPLDKENLQTWQGGDIVTFEQIPGGLWHIAIISDKRREDGVPLIVHNYGYGVKEDNFLLDWPTKISGHFRFNLKEN